VFFNMRVLAIETSCDETAMAIVDCQKLKPESRQSKFRILAEVVSSQIKVHRPYGGVVPHLAKREHLKNLPIALEKLKKQIKAVGSKLSADLIAVTIGPGLEPALWTGINFANDLAKKLKIPVVGINHLEGHIYSNWLPPMRKLPEFPAIVLIVSGGHTILLLMKSLQDWRKLGETRDDAVGEAFDKVAKMLNLPYPGGPEVEKSAIYGLAKTINFPRPMINSKNYDFSFSGLKTAVLYYLGKQLTKKDRLSANVCASFQQAAVDVLIIKTSRAAREFGAKSILLCGGVAANKELRKQLKAQSSRLKANFYVPDFKYNMDNAVMIAAAARFGHPYPTDQAQPNLNL